MKPGGREANSSLAFRHGASVRSSVENWWKPRLSPDRSVVGMADAWPANPRPFLSSSRSEILRPNVG
jgi:hypothetical protein